MNVKALKKQLMAAIAMVCVAAVALSSATYAWFVQNARVTATGPSVTSNTAYSLLISNGTDYQKNWRTAVDMATTSGLTPVSTKGEQVTATNADALGATAGEIRFVTSKDWVNNLVTTYDEVNKESIASGANKYYYTDTVYLKAGQASKIYLDGSVTDDSAATGVKWPDGTGAVKTWSFSAFATTATGTEAIQLAATYDVNGTDTNPNDDLKIEDARALLKTLRVGLMVTDTNDEYGVVTDPDNDVKGFYVYTLGDDSALGTGTESINTTTGDANGITAVIGPDTGKAAGATLTKTTINNTTVFANGTATGVPNITTAIATGSSNAFAADTTNKVAIAAVEANDVVQVDVYVWMEGCDYDVTSGNLEKFAESTIPGMSFGFCVGAAN